MAYGVIYKITCLLNGMKYVGQTTKSTEERFNQHASNKKSYIGRAIRKYGVENFSIEILEECDTCEQLNEREMFWIAALNCKHPNGYNFSDGGEGNSGLRHTQETRAQMSVDRSGEKNAFFGKHHTEESKAKIGAKNRGKKHTDESRKKRALATSGENNPFYGKHHPKELCVKLSAINRGDSPYKNLVKEMDERQLTHTALAKLMGLSRWSVSRKIKGEYNFTNKDKAKLVEIFDKPIEYLLQRDDGKICTKNKGYSPYPNLIAEMDKRQLTHAALAKFMGLSRTAVSYKIRGKYNFNENDKAKLEEIFQKPIEYLLKRDEG